MNNIYLDNLFSKTKNPIWLMRQAGRYLPEYNQVRSTTKNFLEFCYNSDLVAKVTLQPIQRFDFDLAIIFSDILVIPHSLGVKVDFVKNEGPILEKISDPKQLSSSNFEQNLMPVYEGISKTRALLDKSKPLIGFVGAPWTLASYMIEGGGSKFFNDVKNIAYNNSDKFQEIIDILSENIIIHIKNQIKAGVNLIQIFDSWSGVLNRENFIQWSVKPIQKIVHEVKLSYPEIPIIGFPKDAGSKYKDYYNDVKIDILGLDSNISRNWIKENLPKDLILQGNLDPIYLLSNDKGKLKNQITKILDDFSDRRFIFNLGHGILPSTPIENVELLIKIVRNYE